MVRAANCSGFAHGRQSVAKPPTIRRPAFATTTAVRRSTPFAIVDA
jgi:hypothetical protein